MSILSTNKKIIKVQGTEYSAGEGIIIEDNVISVDMSAVSPSFSAGPNIDIYEEDEQSYISGRDWTDLIKEASANAYDSATGAIPEPQDLTYMSGAIDYVSGEVSNASSYSYSQATGYYNTWITGQYEGDITNITNNISSLSSSLSDDYYKKTETSSKGEIDDALQYISANAGKTYEGVSPIVVNNTEDKISAVTWVLSGGNNVTLVDDNINKVTRIDVEVPTPFDPTYMSGAIDNKLDTTAFSTVSGTFLTAHQTIPSAKWENASDVVQSNSAQWSENTGDEEVNNAVYNNSAKWNEIGVYESNSSTYLTAHQSLDGYATQDWVTAQGYITGVDLSDYAKTSSVHNDIDSAVSGKLDTTAFSDVSSNFLTAHQDISYKLDSSAFSDVSGTFLTAINIPESANWNETTSVVESNSAAWGNEFDPSYMSGAIDNKLNTSSFADVSGSFLTAINIPESASWNEATTAYQANSGTYLTAHQDISNLMPKSESANFYPMNENPSGYLTEHQSLDGYATEDWVTGQGYITGVNIPESGTWNDVASTYQTNSSTYLTAHQSLDGYATTSELNSTSSYLSGAIDYVSANAGSTLPSAFVVEEDGQAYKVSAYTSAMNPTPEYYDNGRTVFPISEIGAYVYTTNISNGHWNLNGGQGGDFSNNTIDLTDVPESIWTYSTNLEIQDYSWPFQEATLSTTAEIVERTPYMLSGQGGLSGDYVSGVNWVSAQQQGGIGPVPLTTVYYEAIISGDVKVTTSANSSPYPWTYSLADIGSKVTNNSAGWNQVYNKLDTTAFDTISGDWNEAVTAYQTNSSTYLTAHQTISAEEWNSNYDTVISNSGAWGGSALNISAGAGVKLELVNNTLIVSNDETVLWSGAGTSAVTLSEPITNFNSIKIYHNAYCDEVAGLPVPSEFRFWHMYGNSAQATFKCAMVQTFITDSTHININNTKTLGFGFTATGFTAAVTNNDQYARNIITKVVGINRVAGGN